MYFFVKTNMKKVRTRIAPSPTGFATIGNLRTALFNYLLAKKYGGEFVLRIEDTDKKRSVVGSEEYMIKSLEWLGITPDDGINSDGTAMYRQSEREYKSFIDKLIEKDSAYFAFDSEEELKIVRDNSGKKPFSYNSKTRGFMKNSETLSIEEVECRINNGDNYVIRFKMPENREVKFFDLIYGETTFNTDDLDDKIILKSDGTPTYHGGVVIDDYLMGITHVVRGNEWISSTPLHILMYEAFGWDIPEFAHVPLLLDKKGKKISKRRAKEYDFPISIFEYSDEDSGEIIQGFKELGYEPEAILNALSLLGWNSGTDREIYSKEELINEFSLERVGNSDARVDGDKIKWFNSHYIRNKPADYILENMGIPEGFIWQLNDDKLDLIAKFATERAIFVTELKGSMSYLYSDIDLSEIKFKNVDEFMKVMKFENTISFDADFSTPDSIRVALESTCTRVNVPIGKIMPMLRMALAGGVPGPQLPDIMYLIGKEESMSRIDAMLCRMRDLV